VVVGVLHLYGVDDPQLAGRCFLRDDGLLGLARCPCLLFPVGRELVADRFDGKPRSGRPVHALRHYVRGDPLTVSLDLRSLRVLSALRAVSVSAGVDDHELRLSNVVGVCAAVRSYMRSAVLVVRDLHIGVFALYELPVVPAARSIAARRDP